MNRGISKGIVTIGCVMAFLLVSPACDRQGKSEQSKSAATAAARVATIAPFKVSVIKSVSLPSYQVPDHNNPFLGAAAHGSYNLALVLQVTNTAPDIAKLNDKQMKVQVVDDTGARQDALGYIPIEIGQTESKDRIQASFALDPKTNALTIKRLYTLSDGATLNAEEVFDSAGQGGWTLHLPADKPTIVSCIFLIPSNRKAVQVALFGVKDLIPIPATPPPVR